MATNLRRSHGIDLPVGPSPAQEALEGSWKTATPLMHHEKATVRGLRAEDAESLFSLCGTEPVGRFLWPPPSTAERFIQFIEWTREQQRTGRQICFALVPPGSERAAGLVQVRQLEPNFHSGEWGFVVGQPYWGTGLFMGGAQLVLEYLFGTIGVRRLEARTVVNNGRANSALKKLGAVNEGILRQGFNLDGRPLDQYMWSILADEWKHAEANKSRLH
jgi:[ribosomal protein S5]-alanine N-acetyltransferase